MQKVNRPICALASVRASLGLTQQQMSEHLGVSLSMVKMIETHKRFLSSEGLVKLGELEIRMAAMPSVDRTALPACVQEMYDNDSKDYARKTNSYELDCNYKAMGLERKLLKMQAEYEELISCLHNVEEISKSLGSDDEHATYDLSLHRRRLLQKLSGCSPQQQGILKNKIAILQFYVLR